MRKTSVKYIFSALLLAVSAFLFSCNSDKPETSLKAAAPAKTSSGPNFILISIDTLRADRLGAYGYKRATSPNLDKFASNAAVFENASSVTSWTLPAHVSMLSGLYPSSHGVTQKKGNVVSNDTKMLAEALKARQFRTFGFANGGYVAGHYGFRRGFEEYPRSGLKGLKNASKELNQIHKEQGGTGVGLARAKEKIEMVGGKEPFFIFVHTYDAHCPFNPPQPFNTMFITENRAEINSSKCIQFEESDKLKKEQVWTLSDRYDGNIRWVDDTLGKFFDWFNSTEASKNTYVIITSDHGEEFFEHDHVDHANSLYKELVHIPLLVAGPGIKPGRYLNPISLVDIVPTALELLSMPAMPYSDGVSYANLLKTGDDQGKLPAWRLAELDRGKVLRSAYDDKSNLILEKDEKTKATVKKEYFYHSEDPAEKVNKFDTKNPVVARRLSELDTKVEELSSSEKKAAPAKEEGKESGDAPENLEELKTLGYF